MDIERYSRARQIELGQAISGRRKVYLDACFWIIVRDTDLGVRTGAAEKKLLQLLRRGVARGDIICPISAVMFLELMKQPFTAQRRLATAKLIDQLSKGVSIVPPDVVGGTEVYTLFSRILRPGAELFPMQELIWTKVSYALGYVYPSLVELAAEDQYRLQAGFFDLMWDVPLRQIIEMTGGSSLPQSDRESLTERVNRDCATYADELRSFEDAYDAELLGTVDNRCDVAVEIMTRLGAFPNEILQPADQGFARRVCRNILYYAMQREEHRDVLRTIYIGALLHAAMRWDKRRKFKPNDFYDFEHATVAFAYCDLFLTEKSLCDMVRRPQLNLQALNGCRAIWRVQEAAEAVRQLFTAGAPDRSTPESG